MRRFLISISTKNGRVPQARVVSLGLGFAYPA
jgi:hypothetical protein